MVKITYVKSHFVNLIDSTRKYRSPCRFEVRKAKIFKFSFLNYLKLSTCLVQKLTSFLEKKRTLENRITTNQALPSVYEKSQIN